jgi:hypothetical protein
MYLKFKGAHLKRNILDFLPLKGESKLTNLKAQRIVWEKNERLE